MTPSTRATRRHGDEWEQKQAHFAVAVALLDLPEGTEIWADCKAGPISKALLHSCCSERAVCMLHAVDILEEACLILLSSGMSRC